MTEKYGFVYIWFDRKHKRYYVGSHWGFEDDGYICSSTWMKQAHEHRPLDFKRRIIKRIYTNREDLRDEENRFLIMIKYHEIKTRYYNLHNKPFNVWHNIEEKRKSIGQKISEKKSGKSTGPCSEETKAKISASNTGKKRTDEAREKCRLANLGKKHTDEWKAENAERLRQQWASGLRKSNGPSSEETKRKQSESLKGRKLKQEQIDLLRENNYKQYTIKFFDGSLVSVNGLKKYAADNSIPYVTLHKCFQHGGSIKKYGIERIYQN